MAQVDVVRECLEGGADVNKAKGGWCALHFAASKNAPEVAQLLCEHGADVNASSTKDGWTALIWACSMNNVQVAKILIEHKADVNQPGSKDGSTPLGWCAFKESVEVPFLPFSLTSSPTLQASQMSGFRLPCVDDTAAKRAAANPFGMKLVLSACPAHHRFTNLCGEIGRFGRVSVFLFGIKTHTVPIFLHAQMHRHNVCRQ
jgi:hypothetical protein